MIYFIVLVMKLRKFHFFNIRRGALISIAHMVTNKSALVILKYISFKVTQTEFQILIRCDPTLCNLVVCILFNVNNAIQFHPYLIDFKA